MEKGFTCAVCKRYFPSHYFDTGPGGYYVDDVDGKPELDESGEMILGGDATDGHIPYWYCVYCDRNGGDSPDNPFYWNDKIPWPYPEDITKDIKERLK